MKKIIAKCRILFHLYAHRFGRVLEEEGVAPPYPVSHLLALYDRLLDEPGAVFRAYADRTPHPGERAVYLRHDIDYESCAEGMPLLLEPELERGLRPAIHVRTDEETYRLATYRDRLLAYRERGAEIGLHTTCYLRENVFDALRTEAERFAETLGFPPRSFSVHGDPLGRRQDVRRRFVEEIPARLEECGFAFTDCHPRYRFYGYVLQDCNRHPRTGEQRLLGDFASPPLFLPPCYDWLILSHPCHWRAG